MNGLVSSHWDYDLEMNYYNKMKLTKSGENNWHLISLNEIKMDKVSIC